MEVLGAISSVVAIVEATVNSYKAIKKIRDRPEAFNTVGQQLRSVRDLLNEIHDKTKDNDSAIKTAQNEEFIRGVKECQTKAEALENIFRHLEEKCNNSEESERVWPDHFKNIYKALLKGSKANRVETLMADLWKGIERLAVIKIIGMSDPVQRNVKSAIQYLEEDDPSLDDSEFDSTGIHATQNIATGGTGTQNNVRGDNNIFNSGSFSGGKFGTFNNYGDFQISNSSEIVAEQLRASFLRELESMNYQARLQLTERRLEGTCEWFQQHPGFRDWLEKDEGLLLVSAGAGCGKSVLAKYLIEKLLPEESPTATICYFFFKDSDPNAQRFIDASKALLHCLLLSRLQRVDFCMKELSSNPNKIPKSNFLKVWSVFETLSTEKGLGQIICVLDAFDESDSNQRGEFAQCLKNYISNTDGNPKAKFVVTTRGHYGIVNLFADLSSHAIHLDGDTDDEKRKIQNEINIVMEHNLSSLASMSDLSNSSLDVIRSGLIQNGTEQRTYLWMSLMFEYIKKQRFISLAKWRKIFRNPPDTINEAYEKLLQSVTPNSHENVRTVLSLILAAIRPLTIMELSTATNARMATLESEEFSFDDVIGEAEFRSWVFSECGSFISFLDGKVYLVHQTAKEFLLGCGVTSLGTWRGSMTPTGIHRYMTESCISLLSQSRFRHASLILQLTESTSSFRLGELSSTRRTELSSFRLGELGHFTEYAIEEWLHHFDKCQEPIPGTNETRDIDERFFGAYLAIFTKQIADTRNYQANLDHMWLFPKPTALQSASLSEWDLDSYKDYEFFGILPSISWEFLNVSRLACIFNHIRLLKFALEVMKETIGPEADDFLINVDSEIDLSLPHFAALAGSSLSLKYLQNLGYEMDLQDREGQTPLHQAISGNHREAIETLLGFGASTTTMDFANRTPITLGMIRGPPQWYLRRPSWVEDYLESLKHDHKSMNSLVLSAAMAEIPAKAKWRVRSHQTDVELDEGRVAYRSPLVWFRYYGSGDYGVVWPDPNCQDESGLTALHISAQNERRLYNLGCLLGRASYGLDIDALDHRGNTPLNVAAVSGNYLAAELLVARGADFDHQGAGGNTPLHDACRNGHHELAKLFLDQLADLEIRNEEGWTVLERYKELVAKLFKELSDKEVGREMRCMRYLELEKRRYKTRARVKSKAKLKVISGLDGKLLALPIR